jgi:hypothetical protein
MRRNRDIRRPRTQHYNPRHLCPCFRRVMPRHGLAFRRISCEHRVLHEAYERTSLANNRVLIRSTGIMGIGFNRPFQHQLSRCSSVVKWTARASEPVSWAPTNHLHNSSTQACPNNYQASPSNTICSCGYGHLLLFTSITPLHHTRRQFRQSLPNIS